MNTFASTLAAIVNDGIASTVEPTNGPAELTEKTPPAVAPAAPAKKPKRAVRKLRTFTAADETNIAALRAAGVSKEKISKTLDLSRNVVDVVLKQENIQKFVENVRTVIRAESIARIQQAHGKAWDWLESVIEDRDPKAFDAITRGLSNLERVSSSTSGEASRLRGDVTHTINAELPTEAAALIEALLRKD